jgi:hypothetical protein
MNDDERITTLEVREEPTAQQLIDECKEAITAASAMGVFTRLLNCHETKNCQWATKQGDGRLGEKDESMPVFRWKGAPDLGVPLCGKIIRWLALIRMSVFNRGTLNIGPRKAAAPGEGGGDATGLAAIWQHTCDYFMAISDWTMAKAFKQFSTCVEELGYGVLLADWLPNWRSEKVPVTTQQVSEVLIEKAREIALQQMQVDAETNGLQFDPEAPLPDTVDAAAVSSALVELEMLLASGEITPYHESIIQALDERITAAEARRVIADLRDAANEGKSHYFAKRAEGGMWDVSAPTPWVDFLHPYDMRGDGRCDWIARPVYLSEAQLRARAATEKWNKASLKKLFDNQKNRFWTELSWGYNADWALNGVGIGMVFDMQAMEKMPRWLVVEMWRVVTNKEGLPRIAKAIFNPHMGEDKLLKWQATDLEKLPIIVDTAEPCTYAMMAKGAADIIRDKQNFVKDGLDSEGARGQLGSNPPLLRTVGQHVDMLPGRQLYAKRTGTNFEGSQFMEVPGVDAGHLRVVEKVEQLVEQFYFRSTDTPESDRAMFEEDKRYESLRCYRELMRLLWVLAQENVERLQISRINGVDVDLDAKRDQLQGEADIHIGVHLDGYSKDAAEKFVKVYTQLSQGDRFGALDAAEGMNIATQLLAPTYARRLVMSTEKASGRVVDEQEQRIAKIMAGVPVTYAPRISNPGLRLQVMDQWMQVPGNLQRAQADPVAMPLLQKEMQYLQFQNEQQTKNPTIGRTGVTPNEPTEMGTPTPAAV